MAEDNEALIGQKTQVLVESLTGEGPSSRADAAPGAGSGRRGIPARDGSRARERSSIARSSARTAWTWWRAAPGEERTLGDTA